MIGEPLNVIVIVSPATRGVVIIALRTPQVAAVVPPALSTCQVFPRLSTAEIAKKPEPARAHTITTLPTVVVTPALTVRARLLPVLRLEPETTV